MHPQSCFYIFEIPIIFRNGLLSLFCNGCFLTTSWRVDSLLIVAESPFHFSMLFSGILPLNHYLLSWRPCVLRSLAPWRLSRWLSKSALVIRISRNHLRVEIQFCATFFLQPACQPCSCLIRLRTIVEKRFHLFVVWFSSPGPNPLTKAYDGTMDLLGSHLGLVSPVMRCCGA